MWQMMKSHEVSVKANNEIFSVVIRSGAHGFTFTTFWTDTDSFFAVVGTKAGIFPDTVHLLFYYDILYCQGDIHKVFCVCL